LLVSSPLLILVIAAIKLVQGGPALFSHERIGYGGRSFRCYKLRTMVVNGDEVLNRFLAEAPEAREEWLATRKLKNDPRTTRLGYLLRRSSLDELPQLINIIRGEMSCVGPRPIVADELPLYGPHAHSYLSARPGLTGAWQVSGRSRVDFSERVLMDARYVQNWTLGTDLLILLKTIPATLALDGSC